MIGRLISRLYRRWLDRYLGAYLRAYLETYLPHYLLKRYTVSGGDASRVRIAFSAKVSNTLFNVASGTITIESDAFIGHNVCILTGTHDYRHFGQRRQHDFPREGRDVIVREGAWIASTATLIGPCEIGKHSVVAAGAVVTKNVEPFAIYAGVPAKKIGDVRDAS